MKKLRVLTLLVSAAVAASCLEPFIEDSFAGGDTETFQVQAASSGTGEILDADPIDAAADLGASDYTKADDNTAKTQKQKDEDAKSDNQDGADAGTTDKVDKDQLTVVHISTQDDWNKFAKNCHSDVWSRDKMVVLDNDIIFTDSEPVATFGGIFDGNGHTLKSLSITEDASETGLFGTIQKSGEVKNLSIEVYIKTENKQSKIGGIAGINFGTIKDVKVSGYLDSDSEVGGVVGRNMKNGIISDCTFSGSVVGNSYTGGIAGYNEGTVSRCTNTGSINTTYSDTSVTVDSITDTLENIAMSGKVNSTENTTARTDTGGIAGFSSGVLTSCTNEGKIGYEHVGYNTGGVVGRTSGFVRSCRNKAKVLGRKDVGGIAGQLQPDLQIDFSESTIDKVKGELDTLNSIVNRAVDNAQNSSTGTKAELDKISDLAKTAKDSAKAISDDAENQLDDTADKVNTAENTASDSLKEMSSAVSDISDYADQIRDSVNSMNDEIDDFVDDLGLSDDDAQKVKDGFADLKTASENLHDSVKSLTDTLADNTKDAAEKAESIAQTIKDMKSNSSQIGSDISAILKLLADNPEAAPDLAKEKFYQDLTKAKKLIDALNKSIESGESIADIIRDQKDTIKSMTAEDLQKVVDALNDPVSANSDFLNKAAALMQEKIQQALADGKITQDQAQQLVDAINAMEQHNGNAADAVKKLKEILADIAENPDDIKDKTDEIRQDLQNASSELKNSSDGASSILKVFADYGIDLMDVDDSDVRDAIKKVQYAASDYPDISAKIQNALDSIAGIDLSLDGVSQTVKDAGNNLYSSLGSLLDEMDSITSNVNSDLNTTYGDIRDITDQTNTVVNTLKDALDDDLNPDKDASDYMLDISNEDVEKQKSGRITESTNDGTVRADLNVGGVTGTIGVEYDLDPEEDIRKVGDANLNYIFKAKSIIDKSTNKGLVESKGNRTGGIVGHMELGLVSKSVNYGKVSGGGDYAGGIVGYSLGEVRDCAEKSDISGQKYVGGIVGYGEEVRDNASLAEVSDYQQFVGAIAGKVKDVDSSSVSGNVYYAKDVYGINGVSYKGIAEETTFEKAAAAAEKAGADSAFGSVRITFVVKGDDLVSDDKVSNDRKHDKVVAQVTCDYGGSLSKDQIPEIPAKDGFYAEWSRDSYKDLKADETVYAQYNRIRTTISSGEKRKGGMAVMLADGKFKQNDAFVIIAARDNTDTKETWEVSVPDDGEQEHTFRYLSPSGDTSHIEITVTGEDGKAKKVDTSVMGKYITFKASGNSFTMTAKDTSFHPIRTLKNLFGGKSK